MDKKESELVTQLSGGVGFSSGLLPWGRGNTSTNTENQSLVVGRGELQRFGGTRRLGTSAQEWELSLDNPLTWGVIERERPQRLFDVIAELGGWEWVKTEVDDIVKSAPIPTPLPITYRGRHFSGNTSIASAVLKGDTSTFLFFQDHDGWIKWGVYDPCTDDRFIFEEVIIQAQKSSPVAATWVTGTSSSTIHLIFVNTSGVIADLILISHGSLEYPWLLTPWKLGNLHELRLRVRPASKIAVSRSTRARDKDNYLVVVFEKESSLYNSHICEVVCRGEEEWEVLQRPQHQIVVPMGPLSVVHFDDKATFTILCHAESSGTLAALQDGPDPQNPYKTEEIIPPSHLPLEIKTGGYNGSRRICFASNPYISKDIYVAIRNTSEIVDVHFWQRGQGSEQRIEKFPQICKTYPETDFSLAFTREDRLLIFYIAPSGQMEVATWDPKSPVVEPAKLSRRPIFSDCCARILTGIYYESDDSDSD